MKQTATVSAQSDSKFLNRKDLVAYFLVAGTGAVIQLVLSSLLQDWFGVSFLVSVGFSYLISLVVGFVLTKLFAFDARRSQQTNREMVKFVMVALFSGLVTVLAAGFADLVSSKFFSTYEYQIPFSHKDINVNQMVSYIFGMGCSFVSNYTLHKTFTFQSTGFYDRLKTLIK